MRRRDFITAIAGTAAAWPLAARAQQGERMRRIGVLMASAADDPEYQARMMAFQQALAQLGWTEGRNLRIDARWATTNPDDIRRHAMELAALGPEVILAGTGTVTVAALLQATRSVPIVFTVVIDAVGAGFVASLARPGGNATGFTVFEYGMSGKWLELLKDVAPRVTRAAVLRDPAIASGIGQFGAIQAVAPSLAVELKSGRRARCARDRARAITTFSRSSNGGLIVTPSALTTRHRDLIVTLAAQHKLPAGLCHPLLHHRRRLDLLWAQFHRSVPAGGRAMSTASSRVTNLPICLCRRRRSMSSSSISNSQGARHRGAADAARARRRGDLDDPAQVHHPSGRRGGGVATRGAGGRCR